MISTAEWMAIAFNFFTFLLMAYDKRNAGLGGRRVPEKLFIFLAVVGGSAGVWFGMKLFRHKTAHVWFYRGIQLIIVLQAAILLICFR